MPETEDGTLEQVENGYVIRFERRYDEPIETVWVALIEPEQLKQWTGAGEIEIELVVGGRFVSRTTGPPELVEAVLSEGGSLETTDTILRVEPPRLLEHTFGGAATSVIRWELTPAGDGCLLRLTHTEHTDIDGAQRASFLAGWHDLLDSLGEVVNGTRDASSSSSSMERWEAYKQRYSAQLGETGPG